MRGMLDAEPSLKRGLSDCLMNALTLSTRQRSFLRCPNSAKVTGFLHDAGMMMLCASTLMSGSSLHLSKPPCSPEASMT